MSRPHGEALGGFELGCGECNLGSLRHRVRKSVGFVLLLPKLGNLDVEALCCWAVFGNELHLGQRHEEVDAFLRRGSRVVGDHFGCPPLPRDSLVRVLLNRLHPGQHLQDLPVLAGVGLATRCSDRGEFFEAALDRGQVAHRLAHSCHGVKGTQESGAFRAEAKLFGCEE